MKKAVNFIILITAFLTVVQLNASCKKTETDSENVINDPDGILVKLTWPQFATYTNLDLRLIEAPLTSPAAVLLTSNSTNVNLEAINFTNSTPTTLLIPSLNGDYVLVPTYREGNIAVPYTITIEGISTGKRITKLGNFSASLSQYSTCGTEFLCSRAQANLKLTKNGNRYIVTE